MPSASIFRQRKFWLITIAIVLVAGIAVYRYYKYGFIRTQLTSAVATKSNSLYRIRYDSLELDEIAGNLNISDLSVTGDTITQNKYIRNGDTLAASVLIDAFIPRLEVVGFKTAKALLSKQLSCNKIILLRPKITVNLYPGQKQKKQIEEEGEALYKQILGQFKEIQADTLSVIGAEIVARNAYTGEIKLLTFNTSLVLTDVLIDSVHYYDTSRTLFSKRLSFQTDKIVVGEKPSLAEATRITFDSEQKILGIASIEHKGLQNKKDFNASTSNIVVSGLQVKGAIDALQISIDKAKIGQLDVAMQKKSDKNQDKKSNPSTILSGWVKTFSINNFAAGDVGFKMFTPEGQAQQIKIDNSTIDVLGFSLDTTAVMDETLIDKADNITFSNQLISIASKDRLYKFVLRGLRVNTRNRAVSLAEFALVPQLNETAFAAKAVVQKDRYDISLKNVAFTGINYRKLFNGQIVVENISGNKNVVNIYRDITRQSDGVSKVGKYPHQMIAKVKNLVNINAVALKNTRISYKEKNPLSDTSATVVFDNADINIKNITNDPSNANRETLLRGKLFLLSKIPLDVTMKLHLDQVDKGGFQVSASIDKSFNGSVLNTLTVPMSLMRIDGGAFNGLSFNLIGDNYAARGNLLVKYSDLKVSVMTRDKNKGNFDKKGVKSLLANLVVKNSNPKNGNLRKADVVYERDQTKSIFNMIWKFVFTGLKDIMGP